MKRKTPAGNLAASVCAVGVLLYVMGKTTSPKIILVPFLICAFSMAGKSIAQLAGKEKIAAVFHKVFVAGFLLFWFGFLAAAGYLIVRDQNYSLLMLFIPFTLIGFFLVKQKLLAGKSKKKGSPFRFAHGVSAVLVSLVLLAGIFLLVLGIQRSQWGLAFMGVFFLCGGGAFVLGTLTVRGVFDQVKVDVLGLYMGIVLTLLGIGFAVMLGALDESPGLWILIPLLMSAAGAAQIIKCFKNRK